MGKVSENLVESFCEYFNRLEMLVEKDADYKLEAYSFVMSALHHTLKKFKESRHVTGRELLEGIRSYALRQYGPMARTVINYWGIHSTVDFGKVVFRLVDAGFMTKTEEDSLNDFFEVYNFDEAFKQPLGLPFKDE